MARKFILAFTPPVECVWMAVPENLAAMEARPFDGCVFSPKYTHPTLGYHFLHEQFWLNYSITQSDLQEEIDALNTVTFTKFRRKWVLPRVQPRPGSVDWFSGDMSHVYNNFQMMARFAKLTGIGGLCFDPEFDASGSRLYDYDGGFLDSGAHTFAEYQTQTEACGVQIMNAMLSEYPDMVLFFLFGVEEAHGSVDPPETNKYGLLPSLLNGMYSVLNEQSKCNIILGGEAGYGYEVTSKWASERKWLFYIHDPLPPNYAKRTRISWGTAIDYHSSGDYEGNWDYADPSNNYFTPSEFEENLVDATTSSNKLCWVYSNSGDVKWYKDNGPTNQPHADYITALNNARTTLGLDYTGLDTGETFHEFRRIFTCNTTDRTGLNTKATAASLGNIFHRELINTADSPGASVKGYMADVQLNDCEYQAFLGLATPPNATYASLTDDDASANLNSSTRVSTILTSRGFKFR